MTARDVVERLRDERLAIRHRFGTNAKRRQDGEREAYRLVLQALADDEQSRRKDMPSMADYDAAELNTVAGALIESLGHIRFSDRYRTSALVIDALRASAYLAAPVSAGEPKENA